MTELQLSTSAVSDGFQGQHMHESRTRITKRVKAVISRPLQVLVGLVLILVAPTFVWSHDPGAAQKIAGAERREVRIPVEDFVLTDQSARPFKFHLLRGKVAIIDFAYTTCPDICPLLTASMRQVQDSLHKDERGATFFVTVTTDPEIDSPKVMAAYAKRYGVDLANWAFLTGDEPVLKKVWKNFGVGVKRKARGLIDHTSLTAIVDQSGTVRVAYVGAAPDPKAILQDVRQLLQNH
jgi:protein SCO1